MGNEYSEGGGQNVQGKDERRDEEETGEKKEGEADIKRQEEGNKKWKMAHTARMREIVPGLFLGNVEASYKREMLQENRINAIVSLTNARWVWWNGTTREAGIPEYRHKWVQCVDSSTQDLLVHMSDICDFIDQLASSALQLSFTLPIEHEPKLSVKPNAAPSEAVLIHCDLGISRSPTVIIAYLMRKYSAKREDILAFVQTKQKVKPSANLTRQLQVWEQVRYQVWENDEKTVPKAPYQAFLDDRAALLKEKGLTGHEPLAPQNL